MNYRRVYLKSDNLPGTYRGANPSKEPRTDGEEVLRIAAGNSKGKSCLLPIESWHRQLFVFMAW